MRVESFTSRLRKGLNQILEGSNSDAEKVLAIRALMIAGPRSRTGEAFEAARQGRAAVADDDGIKRKYASAHDLRRAFGLRWSGRVTPAVLKQLMQHESIDTTTRYYVGRDAESVSKILRSAMTRQLCLVPIFVTPRKKTDGKERWRASFRR